MDFICVTGFFTSGRPQVHMLLDILTANQIYQTERYKDVWGAEGISGRVKFLPLGLGCPKQAFAKIATPRSLLPMKFTITLTTVQR